MVKEIIFTIPAQEDLRAIKQYICCDNFEAAQEVVRHILESIERLTDNPSIGRAGRVLRTRELVISKYPYIVPYQVRENNIYVLRVLHTSRKWEL
ncbi:type II toxin-antitoxin system RelE/ParE family toxin [bacterium]|nr:type II toxin-antitoxin system RelE/ParE family toxin [bacterium]